MQAVIAHGALLQSYLAIDETLLDPFGCYLKAPRGKKGKSQWASKVSRNERCQRSIPHCWNCRWVRRVIGWHDGSYGRDNRNRHLPRGGQRSANAWRLRFGPATPATRSGARRTFGSPLGGRKDGASRRFVWPPAIEIQGTIGSDVNWFVTLTQTGKGSSMKYLASSFALVLLATPALAQSIGEKTGVNSVLGVAPTTADFVKEAAISDMFEIQSSQLAQERGNTSEKQFAATMIKDHQKTSEDIKAMISSGDLKADLPTALDSSHQSALDKLKSLKGSDFSSRYDSDQVSGHKDAVSLFERYAKGGENAKLKDWVDKTLPTLRHHLEMAQDLAAGKTVGSH
jgi:putative membrane protein